MKTVLTKAVGSFPLPMVFLFSVICGHSAAPDERFDAYAFLDKTEGTIGDVFLFQAWAKVPENWTVRFPDLVVQNPYVSVGEGRTLRGKTGVEYLVEFQVTFWDTGSFVLPEYAVQIVSADGDTLGYVASDSMTVYIHSVIKDAQPTLRDIKPRVVIPPLVTESGDSTIVAEGGRRDTITIRLPEVPRAPVVVFLENSDGELKISPTTLRFEGKDVLTPKTVIVKAVNDRRREQDHAGVITFGVASEDSNYDGMALNSVTVHIVDNDEPLLSAEQYRTVAMVLGIILLLGVLVWLWRKRVKEEVVKSRIVVPSRPPHEIALEKLAELRQREISTPAEMAEFYEDLSFIVREFLEYQFFIRAIEMTTQEIDEARSLLPFSDNTAGQLTEVLKRADLAKFARFQPAVNQGMMDIGIVEDFIRNVHRDWFAEQNQRFSLQ